MSEAGDGAMKRAVRLHYDLEASPAKVWRALTERALLERWLSPPDAGPRDPVQPARVSVLDCVPGRLIRYGWHETTDAEATSVVSFRIAPNPAGGTRFEIEHELLRSPLPQAANSNLSLCSRAA